MAADYQSQEALYWANIVVAQPIRPTYPKKVAYFRKLLITFIRWHWSSLQKNALWELWPASHIEVPFPRFFPHTDHNLTKSLNLVNVMLFWKAREKRYHICQGLIAI